MKRYYIANKNWLKIVFYCFTFNFKKMKKLTIKPQDFVAAQNDGTPGGLINAAEAYHSGSADSFDFREHDKSVGFTDYQNTPQRAMENDYIKPVLNDADGSFDGYQLVTLPQAQTAGWIEDVAAETTVPTTGA